jgi:trimethyllysine dioxygenase
MDKTNFDPSTLQRSDVPVDPSTGKKDVRPPDEGADYHRSDELPSVSDVVMEDDGGGYRVFWSDGLESAYSDEWVRHELWRWKGRKAAAARNLRSALLSDVGDDDEPPSEVERVLWSGLSEETLRRDLSMTFEELVAADDGDGNGDEGMKRALRYLYRYGILLVTGVPVEDDGGEEGAGEAVAAMASALGGGSAKSNPTTLLHHYRRRRREASGVAAAAAGAPTIVLPRGTDGPLRTLYGTVWSTTSSGPHGQAGGTSVADSAYSNLGLPLHTDMTYLRDPPGLQVFCMVRPAPRGGQSAFCDGFAAAGRLRLRNPEAFYALASVPRRYRSVDPATGWNLEATGPVLTVRSWAGGGGGGECEVTAVRHNDLDRLPDLPPPGAGAGRFYRSLREAHAAWDEILNDDELRLEVGLRRGDAAVVANQVRED